MKSEAGKENSIMADLIPGSTRSVTPAELHDFLVSRKELAVIDVREVAVHARSGHLLRSISLPLSQLELRIAQLVPGRNSGIVVYDDGEENLAGLAVERLIRLGYSDVALLEGGTRGWRAAGYELYTGRNVIGKAFAEHIEHAEDTPSIDSIELLAKIRASENIVVLDSRQEHEFFSFSLPTAMNAPGVELLYRFYEAVEDPDSLVVVNCAGRTRSIIGAQGLINAGVPNKIVCLRDGTMDWLLNGFELENRRSKTVLFPSLAALNKAKESQIRLARRFQIQSLKLSELRHVQDQAQAQQRSFYLIDIRTQGEFEAGHFPGSQWAPGGQLVHQLGEWVGAQNSHIVLVDNTDVVRATLAASWIKQIGWADVSVFGASADLMSESGVVVSRPTAELPGVEYINAQKLKQLLDAGTANLIDLGFSRSHIKQHIPQSRFAIRSRLPAVLNKLDATKQLVLTSDDGILAAHAALDLTDIAASQPYVLSGGTAAWREAGFALSEDITEPLHAFDDFVPTAYEEADPLKAFKEYLAWEKSLASQVKRDLTALFAAEQASRDNNLE